MTGSLHGALVPGSCEGSCARSECQGLCTKIVWSTYIRIEDDLFEPCVQDFVLQRFGLKSVPLYMQSCERLTSANIWATSTKHFACKKMIRPRPLAPTMILLKTLVQNFCSKICAPRSLWNTSISILQNYLWKFPGLRHDSSTIAPCDQHAGSLRRVVYEVPKIHNFSNIPAINGHVPFRLAQASPKTGFCQYSVG